MKGGIRGAVLGGGGRGIVVSWYFLRVLCWILEMKKAMTTLVLVRRYG